MAGGCAYLEDIEKLSGRSQNVLYFFLGGTIACPRCSRPGTVVYHKLTYIETEEHGHEKMDQA